MTNRGAAENSIKRAGIVLQEAEALSAAGHWNLSVRRCQESVELALKGALAWAGVEVPKVHDVGPLLRLNVGRFAPQFAEAIPQLASISRALRAERELSFYGDPESGIPPEELYTEDDALEALRKARFVLDQCKGILATF
ncbi:MAG: HEPN domain-containing protein [Bacillota bacterium]|nr:HEPN domain-containing protein [Bacillota bacterium]